MLVQLLLVLLPVVRLLRGQLMGLLPLRLRLRLRIERLAELLVLLQRVLLLVSLPLVHMRRPQMLLLLLPSLLAAPVMGVMLPAVLLLLRRRAPLMLRLRACVPRCC